MATVLWVADSTVDTIGILDGGRVYVPGVAGQVVVFVMLFKMQ